MVKLTESELSNIIKPCGLNNAKAKHILQASRSIIDNFNGQVPSNFDDILSLPGVGRKTADVMVAVAFNGDAIAVDTHVFRVSNRIGLAKANNVLKTEKALNEIIDEEDWSRAHHYLIYLGRSYCKAKNPDCENCPINSYCEKNIKR